MGNATTTTWGGQQLDLDAYLARIGYRGEPRPTATVLRELHRAHVETIPFENLEIVLGRPIPLDIDVLQDKLVRQRRGGYCFEHTTLFAAALERLGFGVTGLTGRVAMGMDTITPQTHAVLRVHAPQPDGEQRVWLADTGFGGSSPEPLQLAHDAETTWGDWTFRLRQQTSPTGPDVWTLQRRGTADWLDLHHFSLLPQYPVDYGLGNYYIHTHPRSPFTGRLMIQKLTGSAWYMLDDTRLHITGADGSIEHQQLEPNAVAGLLRDQFGIELDAQDTSHLTETLERSAAQRTPARAND